MIDESEKARLVEAYLKNKVGQDSWIEFRRDEGNSSILFFTSADGQDFHIALDWPENDTGQDWFNRYKAQTLEGVCAALASESKRVMAKR